MATTQAPSLNSPAPPKAKRGRPTIAEKVPDAVREIKALHSAKVSIRGIVQAMNDAGIPSANGGKWHIRTVQIALATPELDTTPK